MSYWCNVCDRSFESEQSLQQHLHSPAHVYECDACDRSFGSKHSLQQHLDSPAHVYECDACDRSFGSKQSLQQHLESPAHDPIFECDACERAFRSEQALQQHSNSSAHSQDVQTQGLLHNRAKRIPNEPYQAFKYSSLKIGQDVAQDSEKSVNTMLREAGFDSIVQFLSSYGLRIYKDVDMDEGIAILRAMYN